MPAQARLRAAEPRAGLGGHRLLLPGFSRPRTPQGPRLPGQPPRRRGMQKCAPLARADWTLPWAGRCPWRSLAVRLAVLVIPPLIGCGGSAVNGSTEGGSSQLTVSSPDSQGRHSRTSSPATAPADAPTCSGAAATRTRELAIEMLDPTRRVAASPTGWSTGSRPRLQPGGCADGAAEGVNDFGRPGYGGPRPPRGAAHHCHFVALALDTRLGLAAGAKEVRAGVTHHRSRARQRELVATYQRA